MYSKHEVSQQTKLFWTTLGKYMAPIASADGLKVNWINYKTEVKNISFRMTADNNLATIFILINHPNIDDRKLFFKQFEMLKTLLHQATDSEWIWQFDYNDDLVENTSRIYKQIQNVSILNKDHWPQVITFFKQNMLALDRFWSDAKYSFQELSTR